MEGIVLRREKGVPNGHGSRDSKQIDPRPVGDPQITTSGDRREPRVTLPILFTV